MTQLNYRKLPTILTILGIVNICSGKVPSTIQICSRNDPNLDQCIINSVHKLRPYLATGDLGEGFTVPSLEPFIYEGFSINPSPNFLVKVKNANVTGTSNFMIEKLKFNFNKISLDMVAFFPEMILRGAYDLRAKISNINGRGDLKAIVYKTKMRIKLNGVINGSHVKFEKVNIRLQVDNAKINLSNLFNGDPTLQSVGNQLVNENQGIFIEQILPVMEKQFAKLFQDVGNAIAEKATIDELFPENPAFGK